MEEKQLFKLATTIKQRRKAQGLNLEALAGRAGVSKSLISKIENHRTIPSLPVILRIAQGLKTNLSELSAGIEVKDEYSYILVRKNERLNEEKEEAVGFQYQSLVMENINNIFFETSILSIEKGAKRKPVSSDGSEFLYILKGSIEFLLGEERILLTKGDAFFFDGRIPHVPINIGEQQAELLVVYLIEQNREEP